MNYFGLISLGFILSCLVWFCCMCRADISVTGRIVFGIIGGILFVFIQWIISLFSQNHIWIFGISEFVVVICALLSRLATYDISSAAICGHTNSLRRFIENGVDVNAFFNGYSVLHLACDGGHLETVQFLIDKGADIESLSPASGTTPLYIASQLGCLEIQPQGSDLVIIH